MFYTANTKLVVVKYYTHENVFVVCPETNSNSSTDSELRQEVNGTGDIPSETPPAIEHHSRIAVETRKRTNTSKHAFE